MVIEELSIMKEDPVRHSAVLSIKSTFEDHPLEHLVIGTEKHIENYCRDEIYKYYKKYSSHYSPPKTMLTSEMISVILFVPS